jgi:hypothetical protein
MKKYIVRIKQVYTYTGVEAKNKIEAMEKIVNSEWNYSDDDLETSAELEKKD